MARQTISKQSDCDRALKQHADGAIPNAANDAALSQYEAFTTQDDDGAYGLTVAVGGVHCAGCIHKIESALYADLSVKAARLNFSTSRLTLSWDGSAADADRLIARVTALGYTVNPYDPRDDADTHGQEGRSLLLCLGVAGFAAGNIMLLSFGLWSTSGEIMGVAMRDFLHWIAALIAIPAIAFSGRPFFISAAKVLRAGHTNMDVPISLALFLTVGVSLFETFSHGEHVYFDSAVMLMFFLLIGRYLDFRARQSARTVAGDLLALMGGTASVLEDGQRRIVPIRDLREGMVVVAGMGERIPADGVTLQGTSGVDTSLVTGESLPQNVTEGTAVYGGTMNMDAPLTIEVKKAVDDSLLADIVAMMEQAEQAQARYVRLADRAARLYTPVVHAVALASFIGWLVIGGLAWQPALLIAVTVLIITCPCALGLAVPVVQVLAIGKLMKHNLLVKSGDALERLAAVDTVLLDKTGTLTMGRPIMDEAAYNPKIWGWAASLATHSRHPLAQALATSWAGALFTASEINEYPGQGIEALLDGQKIRLGSRSWCGLEDAPHHAHKLELWFQREGAEPVPFYFEDGLRPDAAAVVSGLKARGFDVRLLSGDRAPAAAHIAATLGIDTYRGEMRPQDKFDVLHDLKQQGHKVLMIGDGLNDAPTLAGADVSMAPSSAIDMAQNAADIVFMGEHLSPVVTAIDTAQFSQKLVRQNFALAVSYNVIAVPLAVLGHVTPMIAALAMSGSSLVVIANSFRLRRDKARKNGA